MPSFSQWFGFVVLPAPEIDEAAAMQLAEMGFPLEACRKAVYYTGNMGPEMAFNWIIAHMEEPGTYGGGDEAPGWPDKTCSRKHSFTPREASQHEHTWKCSSKKWLKCTQLAILVNICHNHI